MKQASQALNLVLSLVFLSGSPLLKAKEWNHVNSVIPLIFSKDAFDKLEIKPRTSVTCEITFFTSPGGTAIYVEPSERLYWIQDHPVLLLGSHGNPLPEEVLNRGVVYLDIAIRNRHCFKDKLRITPRSMAVLLSDSAPFRENFTKMLQNSSGNYDSQVAYFLTHRLSELNIKGDSYQIDPYGEVINASGEWVGGNMVASGEVTGQSGKTMLVPSGAIILWNGVFQEVNGHTHPVVDGTPNTDWYLCDGSTVGTVTLPDMRNRFIMGAQDVTDVGTIGGASSVTLNSSQIPSHKHTIATTTGTTGAHTHQWEDRVNDLWPIAVDPSGNAPMFDAVIDAPHVVSSSEGSHNHTISGQTGLNVVTGTTPMPTLPRYFALAYIMSIPQNTLVKEGGKQ